MDEGPLRNNNKELLLRVGIPAALFFINLVILIRSVPLFWDSVQFGSLHAEYFLRTEFQSLLLSNQIDSGNPPFFGIYIAWMWKIFGKSLVTSHLAMLPFLFLIIGATLRLTAFFVKGRMSIWFAAIIILDTTLLAQATLVSPDVLLVAFFLLTLVGILEQNTFVKLIGAIGLAMISSRSQVLLLALIFFNVIQEWRLHKNRSAQNIFESLAGFLPGVFMVLFYSLYHYIQKGWIGYHADSPWAPSFELVGAVGFIKNIFVFGWRLIDLGHIFTFIPAVITWVHYRKSPKKHILLEYLFVLLIILYLFSLPQLVYQGLLAHRYFLPIYLVNGMIAIIGVQTFMSKKQTQNSLVCMVLVLGMMSGHLWNYPRTIAQGWDSKLSYIPYNNLVTKAKSYIDFLNINYNEVGTAFPSLHSEYFTHLNNNTRKFKSKDIGEDLYILYSNVMNDYTDREIRELFTNWEILMAWKESDVEVILFKRK